MDLSDARHNINSFVLSYRNECYPDFEELLLKSWRLIQEELNYAAKKRHRDKMIEIENSIPDFPY